jgi:predicted amidohydrolase
VKVAGIVLKWVRGDKEANYRRAEPMIRKAALRGAKIICTTECFLDGYAARRSRNFRRHSSSLNASTAIGTSAPRGSSRVLRAIRSFPLFRKPAQS